MNQNTHIEESLAEADENDESKEPSPQKRRRVGSPARVKKVVKAKLAPKDNLTQESVLERAKREARETLSRRAAEYVVARNSSDGAVKASARKRKST